MERPSEKPESQGLDSPCSRVFYRKAIEATSSYRSLAAIAIGNYCKASVQVAVPSVEYWITAVWSEQNPR